ncbi:hypothetical protein BT93_K1433 [Corymbia citriodora subsp. variegata]|nr:hypothetical protein BT93_K1433 [Corymbia citriodora subsp. variegata]
MDMVFLILEFGYSCISEKTSARRSEATLWACGREIWKHLRWVFVALCLGATFILMDVHGTQDISGEKRTCSDLNALAHPMDSRQRKKERNAVEENVVVVCD